MSLNRNYRHSIISSSSYDEPQESSYNSSNLNQNSSTPLINSTVASNSIDNRQMNQQRQDDEFYFDNSMDVDEPVFQVTDSINPRRLADIDADIAYALKLQEEEYSRNSLVPSQSYQRGSNNDSFPSIIIDPDEGLLVSDADLAAHLQAEENRKQKKHPHRPTVPTRRPVSRPATNRTSQTDEPEIIPITPFAEPTPNHSLFNRHNNRFPPFLQIIASASRSNRHNGHGATNLQNVTADFGPNDYENLLELDNTVGIKALTKEQINRLPTEKFHQSKNKNDEENKCSICMDQFEFNQTLRRLPCLHLYHKDCIDTWLKRSDLCPVCRISSIK